MIRCFWCGAVCESDKELCKSCKRALKLSPLLQAILKPSIGSLSGAKPETTTTYAHRN